MRKRYKNKKKSCGLCKPNKRGWMLRWSAKEGNKMAEAEKDIRNYMRNE